MIHRDREGENLLDSRDAQGLLFIKQILERKTGVLVYTVRGPQDSAPVRRLAAFDHYAPLDLTIVFDVEEAQIMGLADAALGLVVLGLALTFAGLLTAVFFMSRIISRPIRLIQETINRSLIQGDLTKKLAVRSRDEIGRLSEDFNKFIERLSILIGRMRHTVLAGKKHSGGLSEKLEETISLLVKLMGSTRSISREMFKLVDMVALSSSATEEIAANVRSFSGRIEDQATAIAQTSSSVEQISASIQNVAKIVQNRQEAENRLRELSAQGATLATEAAQTVGDFAKRADAMMDMTKTINDVAAQTNLLAMNAAIEAAHAGDAGKGFAVVADEIRKLAESTALQAKEIASSLKQVMGHLDQAKGASEKSGESFRQIAQEIEASVQASGQIALAMEELAVGSREIVNANSSLTGIAEEIRQGSREINLGTEQINVSLLKTKASIEKVSEDLQFIKSGVMDVNIAELGISEINIKTSESIEDLQSDFQGFTTADSSASLLPKSRDFSKIRIHHRELVLKVYLALSDALMFRAEDAVSSRTCELGRWLYDERALETYRHLPELAAIETLHNDFHVAAAEILRLKAQERLENLDEKLQGLSELSIRLLAVLDEAGRKLPV